VDGSADLASSIDSWFPVSPVASELRDEAQNAPKEL